MSRWRRKMRQLKLSRPKSDSKRILARRRKQNSPSPAAKASFGAIRELLAKARSVMQNKKRKKLDRIMTLFEKRASIINDEVEKLLHVSDATTRYLNILEQEGKIKQSGKTGKFVSYTKI